MQKTKTLAAIERRIEERQSSGFRRHLGASVIGRECARELWYIFRWAKAVRHRARLLRLFDRGNLEEERFVRWLRDAGIHVVTHDPTTGKQVRIEDHNGHFGGSLDSSLFDTPDFPMEWVLGEFKTHNNKSFNEVVKKGVRKEKWEHFVQMQIYMHYTGMRAALYFAVNKDNDEIHLEIVEYEKEIALGFIERAGKIIESPHPPVRINDNPSWYKCQWCDFKKVCHDGEPKAVNCRTCVHARPIENGAWLCQQYSYVLTEADQRRGCTSHTPIKED